MLCRKLPLVFSLVALSLLAACSKDMEVQNRTKTQRRPAVSAPTGTIAARMNVRIGPSGSDQALATRGRERFSISCTPCHDAAGSGNGLVVQRGFPQPESFLSSRVVQLSDQNLYDTITGGLGVMPAFKRFITSEDRRAIVAYIRVLQREGHAK